MKSTLIKFALKLEAFLEQFKPDKNAIRIVPYIGYTSHRRGFLHGRVVRKNPLTPINQQDTIWHSLASTYRRSATDKVPDVAIQIILENFTLETRTDNEGVFRAEIALPVPLTRRHYTVQYAVDTAVATGDLFNAGTQSQFGIISDLDDMVLQTQEHDPLRMMNNAFFENVQKRSPFPGITAFYRALQQPSNPIFYISNSPWNLHDVFIRFFKLQKMPPGPLFLQDYGLKNHQRVTHSNDNKLEYIRQIMADFTPLPFIVIGSSTQYDPYKYTKLIEEYGRRIIAVYIGGKGSKNQIDVGSPMLAVRNAYEAAQHAYIQGLLSFSYLDEIFEEMQQGVK